MRLNALVISNNKCYTMIKLHVMTRLHLGAPFRIRQIRLNDNDSYPDFLFQPLIEDEMPNPMDMPKFSCLYACSSTKNVFLDFLSY